MSTNEGLVFCFIVASIDIDIKSYIFNNFQLIALFMMIKFDQLDSFQIGSHILWYDFFAYFLTFWHKIS